MSIRAGFRIHLIVPPLLVVLGTGIQTHALKDGRTMGKSQKKRSMRRHNPMRVPDSHLPKGLAAASSSSNKAGAVLPIIQKVRVVLFLFLFFLAA